MRRATSGQPVFGAVFAEIDKTALHHDVIGGYNPRPGCPEPVCLRKQALLNIVSAVFRFLLQIWFPHPLSGSGMTLDR